MKKGIHEIHMHYKIKSALLILWDIIDFQEWIWIFVFCCDTITVT